MGSGEVAPEGRWLLGGWHPTQGTPSGRQLPPSLEQQEEKGADRSSLGRQLPPSARSPNPPTAKGATCGGTRKTQPDSHTSGPPHTTRFPLINIR